jgi:hypothetical protein
VFLVEAWGYWIALRVLIRLVTGIVFLMDVDP